MELHWGKIRQRKASLLEKLPKAYPFKVNFNFHNQSFSFYSTSKEMVNLLESYLPDEWKKKETSSTTTSIFHDIPSSRELEELFSDDPSSGLFHYDNIVIQRDFVAKTAPEGIHTLFRPGIDDGLHNFFRWLLSPLLISDQKAMLHCSAIVKKKGRADIFLGPSGAGKTTITELALAYGNLALSDDMNLISIEDSSLFIYPGGVGGLYKPQAHFNRRFEVDHLYWIVQSAHFMRSPLHPVEQNKALITSFANLPWRKMDGDARQSVLKLTEEILSLKEVEELSFPKDETLWKKLDP